MLGKLKASKPKFNRAEKNTRILDCFSDEYFIVLYYFKTEKRKYKFFLQSLVEFAYRVQHFLLLYYSNLYTFTVYDNALPV